ncbi:MAG TPA: GDSL-type esterase/lipase family protein [Fimbriimonadaceae bacterium]|nr:GDSL-type esterase/lipase family protein [Fimbriimonadaceae bacterium]HRJ96551.1 GDSL-type esterase/lipase family protein [Fimbriimonadaceae bacterium]
MRRTFALLLFALAALACGQNRTLLCVGDSVSWGYQPNDLTRSPGDKGFVRLFADWLGSQYGTRPQLSNLAIPGESTASYFDTSEIGGLLNSNYPILFRPSQRSKVDSTITAVLGSGRQIPYVTFALGANDLLEMLDAAFLAQSLTTQMQQADQAIQAADARLVTSLTAIRQRLPGSILLMPGYYNPYPPSRPEHPIATYAIPRLNAVIRARALQFSGRYVATDAPFVGREIELTWIGQDDVHPRDAGYQVIFDEIISNVRLVTGVIDFDGLATGAILPPRIAFQIASGAAVIEREADLAADGSYRLTAPPGALSLSLKRTHWLRRTITIDTSVGDVAEAHLVLVNGDVDGDNEVAIGDYALLSSAFGASLGDPHYLPGADLDEDQTIDIGDFAILSSSFGTAGDD